MDEGIGMVTDKKPRKKKGAAKKGGGDKGEPEVEYLRLTGAAMRSHMALSQCVMYAVCSAACISPVAVPPEVDEAGTPIPQKGMPR